MLVAAPADARASTSAPPATSTTAWSSSETEGTAILVVSEDLDEVLSLADRILVMYEGEIISEVDPRTATVGEIGLLMAGVRNSTRRQSGPRRRGAGRRSGDRSVSLPEVRIEKRLHQRRWLMVAVPFGSLVVALAAIAVLLTATGHSPPTTFRRLFDAGFLADGALGNTLIAATPLAFTGLAAAVAFRMRLFNIGAEGRLYLGAIGAAGVGAATSHSQCRARADLGQW